MSKTKKKKGLKNKARKKQAVKKPVAEPEINTEAANDRLPSETSQL